MATADDIKKTLSIPIPTGLQELYSNDYYALAMQYMSRDNNFAKLSPQDKETFLMRCARSKLDPTLGEIYPIIRGGKLTVVTNYLIYARRANETNLLDGYGETEFGGEIKYKTIEKEYNIYDYGKITGKEKRMVKVIDKDNSTLWCKHTLYRKDNRHPHTVKIWLSEFAPEEPGQWVERPRYMLEKCAFAINHRKAFQGCDRMESLPYSEEELNSTEHTIIPVQAEVTDIPNQDNVIEPIEEPIEEPEVTTDEKVDEQPPAPPDNSAEITDLQAKCEAGIQKLASINYRNYSNATHQKNSNKKYLDTNTIKACNDVDKLNAYYNHLLAEYWASVCEERATKLGFQPYEEIFKEIESLCEKDDHVALHQIADEFEESLKKQGV